jgi:hypothetical protein
LGDWVANLVAAKPRTVSQLIGVEESEMTNFKEGDRVFHIRSGDRFATKGYGRILWIEGTRASLRWEYSGKEGGVESRDLITEEKAWKAELP